MANRMPGPSPIRGGSFSMTSTQTRFHTSSVGSWAAAAAHQPSQSFGMANMTGFTMMQSVDPYGSSYSVTQVASATAFVGGCNQQSTMVQTVVQETRIQAGVGGTFAIPNGFRPLRSPQPGGPRFQRPGAPTMANHGAHLQSLLSSTRFGMSSPVRLYPQTGTFGGPQTPRHQQPGPETNADQEATSPKPAADSPSWPKLSPASGTTPKDDEPSSTHQPAPAWRKRPAAPAEPSKFAKRPSPRPSWPSLGKPTRNFPRVPQKGSTPSFPTPRQKSPAGRPSGPGPTNNRTSPSSDYNFNPSWLRPPRPTAPPTTEPRFEPKPPRKSSSNSKEKKSTNLLTEDPPLVPPKNKTLPGFSPAEATDPPVVNQWTAGGGLKWGEVLKKKETENKAEAEKKKKFSLEKEEFPPLLGDTQGSRNTAANCWEKGNIKLLTAESEQKSEGKKGDARNQQDAKKQKSKPEAGLKLVVLGSTGKGAGPSAPKARTAAPQRTPEEVEVVKPSLAWVAESLVKVPSADAKVDTNEEPDNDACSCDITSNQHVIQEMPQPHPAPVDVCELPAVDTDPRPQEDQPPRSLSWAQRVAGITASCKESSSDSAKLEYQPIEDLYESVAAVASSEEQQQLLIWRAEEKIEDSKEEIQEFTQLQEDPRPETQADPSPTSAMLPDPSDAAAPAEVQTSISPQWYDPFVSSFPSWIPETVQQGIVKATSADDQGGYLEQYPRHQPFHAQSHQPANPLKDEDWDASFTDVFNRHMQRCRMEESSQQPVDAHVPEPQTISYPAEQDSYMQHQQPAEVTQQTRPYIRPPPGLPPPGIDFEYPLHVLEEVNGRGAPDHSRQTSDPAAADGLPATVAGEFGSAATLMKKLSCLEAGLPQQEDLTMSASVESCGGPQKRKSQPRLPTWLEQWEEQWQKAQQEAKEQERLARVNHPNGGLSWGDFFHPSLEQENLFPGENLEGMDTEENQTTPQPVDLRSQQDYGLNSARQEMFRMPEDNHAVAAGVLNSGGQAKQQQMQVDPYATTGQPNAAYMPGGSSCWGVRGTKPFQPSNRMRTSPAAQQPIDHESPYYTTTSRRRRRKRKPRIRPLPPSSPKQNGFIPSIQPLESNYQGYEGFVHPSSPHGGEVFNSDGQYLNFNGSQPFHSQGNVGPSLAGNLPTVEATTNVFTEEDWNHLLSLMIAQSMYDPDSPEFLSATASQEPVYPEQLEDPSEGDDVRNFSSMYEKISGAGPSKDAAGWVDYQPDQDGGDQWRPDLFSPNHDSQRNSAEASLEIEEASDGVTAESLGVTEADLEVFRRVRRMLLNSGNPNAYEGDLLRRRYYQESDEEDSALQDYESYPGTDSNVESSQSAAKIDEVQQIEENLQQGTRASFSDNRIFVSAVASGQIDLQRSWSLQSTWMPRSQDYKSQTSNEGNLEEQDGVEIGSPPNVVEIPGSFLLKATEINQQLSTDSVEPASRAIKEDRKEVVPEAQLISSEAYKIEEEGQQPSFISDLAWPASSNEISIQCDSASINVKQTPGNQPAADKKNQQNTLDDIIGEETGLNVEASQSSIMKASPGTTAGLSPKADIQQGQAVADVDSSSDEQEGSDHIGQGDGVSVGQVQGVPLQPEVFFYPQYPAAGGDHQYSGLALQREDLLYILALFYKYGPMHLAAAEELYRRKWRFHKAMGVWMTGTGGRTSLMPRRHLFSITENPYMAIRSVKYFDAVAWSMKIEEKFFLRFADLEMQRPSLGGHIHSNSYYYPPLQGDSAAPSANDHGRMPG